MIFRNCVYREKIEILFHDMIEYSDQAKTQTNERTNEEWLITRTLITVARLR